VTVAAPEMTPETAPESGQEQGVWKPRTDRERMAVAVESTFEELSATAPKGWRVELIERAIHVVPPANGEHETILSNIVRQMNRRSEDDSLWLFTGIGLRLPGQVPNDKVVPDLTIAPEDSFGSPEQWHQPAPVVLVAEITSKSTGDEDRGKKLRAYARAHIPHYLLVDRKTKTVTLYGEPTGEGYRQQKSVPFSIRLPLPEPFGFELDTRKF
jgi:Uma2 family endonuclease